MASTSSDTDEVAVLEQRIQAITDVLKTPVSEEDKLSLQFMLRDLQVEKAELQKKKLGSLLAKYGHASSLTLSSTNRPLTQVTSSPVISIDSPAPVSSVITRKDKSGGRGGKKSKDSPGPTPPSKAPTKRKRDPVVVDDSESDGLPTPPTKIVKTGPSKVYPKGQPKKKKNVKPISPDRVSDKDYSPPRITPAKKKKTKKGPAPKTPVEVPDSDDDSDAVIEKASARAKQPTGHKPDLNWCSSGTEDEGPLTHSKYTDQEKIIMYNTAEEDPQSIIGLRGQKSSDERIKRKRKLFIRMKRNVNSQCGRKRRKKYLSYFFSQHKYDVMKKKRELEKEFGYSGAPAMPPERALKPIELRCLDLWGQEACGFIVGAEKTELDADSDAASEDDAREMSRAEKAQSDALKYYKQKKKEREMADDIRKKYNLESGETANVTIVEPSPETTKLIKAHKPARPVRVKKSTSSTTAELEPAAEEEDEKTTPVTRSMSKRAQKATGSSDRGSSQDKAEVPAKSKEQSESEPQEHLWNVSQSTSRALEYTDDEGPTTQDFADLPEVTHSPMPSMSEHDGEMDYSIHIRSPPELSSRQEHRLRLPLPTDVPKRKQSTPVNTGEAKRKAVPVSTTTVIQIKKEKGDAAEDGSSTALRKPHTSKEKPPTSTISKPSSPEAKATLLPFTKTQFYGKKLATSTVSVPPVDARRSPPASTSRPNIAVGSPCRAEPSLEAGKDDVPVHADLDIEDKVYLGLADIKEDWERQGRLIESLKKEVLAMRTEVHKTTSLPVEVRKVSHDISGLVDNVNTFSSDFVEIRSSMIGVQQDVQSGQADMASIVKSCHTLKGDAQLIKGSTETIKSRYLGLSIEHQTMLGEMKASREDTQQTSTSVQGLKSDLETVAGDIRGLKVDMASVQKDLFAVKGDVACIRHDIAGLQATGSRIEEGLKSLRLLIQPFPVVNVPVDEIKSDSDEIPPTPPSKRRPVSRSSKATGTDSEKDPELNTSEVTFKPMPGETYGSRLFEDRPVGDSHDTRGDTEETQDPTSVTMPEVLVPDTEDGTHWPSAESAGDSGLVEYAEAGPSSSHPGYMTVVGRTSPTAEFKTVGYIKHLSADTESQDESPEPEQTKTPASTRKKGKCRSKSRDKK